MPPEQGSSANGGNSAIKWIAGLIVLVLAIWGVMASQKNKNTSTDQNTAKPIVAGDTYKIGAILPLTGDAAAYGEPGRNAEQLAVDEINASGGVNGKKLEIIFEDGKCNGKDATNAMQKLVNVDKVQFVIGGFCSSESLAAGAVATASKVPLLSPGSTSPKLTNFSPYFFRISPSDASQGSLDAQVAKDKGYKTVAFIQEQLDYPLGIYQAFSDSFGQLGGQTIKEEFPSAATDFKTQLAKLKAKNPDALFIDTQTPANTERILKQLKDLNWKPNLFINEATAGDSKTIMANKELLEGAIGAEFSSDPANPKFVNFLKAYKDKYGKDAEFLSYAQTEYDTVFIVAEGIKAVGYDGEKLAQWSRTIKDWQGASGSVTIKPDGDRTNGYSSEMVKDGKMTAYVK